MISFIVAACGKKNPQARGGLTWGRFLQRFDCVDEFVELWVECEDDGDCGAEL